MLLASGNISMRELINAASRGVAESGLGSDEDGTGDLKIGLLQRSLGDVSNNAMVPGPALASQNECFMTLTVRASAVLLREASAQEASLSSHCKSVSEGDMQDITDGFGLASTIGDDSVDWGEGRLGVGSVGADDHSEFEP